MKNILIGFLLLFASFSYSQLTDSTHYKQYVSDRDYFLKLQETVSGKNQYIGLQWCIDLLTRYIQMEEMRFKQEKENEKH